MKKHGHQTLTVDLEEIHNPDLCKSVLDLRDDELPQADILWASPPCTAFSVASIGANWTGGYRAYEPKTDKARLGISLVDRTIKLIGANKPVWWFIENPRGVLRKLPVMDGMVRHTVTYCQYGDTRMKPTDIWTNAHWWKPRQVCKNGDKCHEAAPRGSRTGTQGLKGAKERGVIPPALFEEILEQMPK